MYRGPSRGPCIGIIYTHPSRVGVIHPLFPPTVIATLLDPRGKGEYVEFFYQKICRNTDQIRTCVNAVLLWMKKYYVEYEQCVRRVDAYSMAYSSEASSSVGSPVLTKRQLGQEFANFKSSQRKTRAPKSEIDIYFEEDCVEDIENFDIFGLVESTCREISSLVNHGT